MLGNDMTVVARLLEIVAILWRSVEKALKQNEEAQKYTFAKFGNVTAKYFQAFEVLQSAQHFLNLLNFSLNLPCLVN